MGYYVLGFVTMVIGGFGLSFTHNPASWMFWVYILLIVLGVFNIVMRRINKRQ